MAQLDQVDFKLFLEGNGVKDPGRVCQRLSEHGVTATISQFAELSRETLVEWGIASNNPVCTRALPHAQRLLVDSSHNLAAIRQQLLVRARMHYMDVSTLAE